MAVIPQSSGSFWKAHTVQIKKEGLKTQETLNFQPFMASPGRFERPTFRLGGECSILLSYGDKYLRN